MLSPWTAELSLAGNKGASQRHPPHPSPSQNPKGNQFLPGNLPAPPKHPKLCFCGATPLAAGLTPSHCHRAPPEVDPRRRSELSLPLLPLCTLLPTPANTPDPQHHKPAPQAWQCASSPDGPRHPTVNPAPRRGEEKAHTSLTVAPVVGWGQTSSLTAAPPTNSSDPPQHRGSVLQVRTTPGTIQNDQTEEFPSKESPGNNNS